MEEYNLLLEEPTVDSDGTQYNEYRSALNETTISVEKGELTVDIDIERDTVDQFAELIDDLEQAGEPSDDDE